MPYGRVTASTDLRRPWTITCGLVEAGPGGPVEHLPYEAMQAHADWVTAQVTNDAPYLNAVFTKAERSRAVVDGDVTTLTIDPVLVVSGEVSVLRDPALSDTDAADLVDTLAQRIGAALGQARVVATYRDTVWILNDPDR